MSLESGKVDRITGISSMAMRNVLAELSAGYEQQSGQPVSVVAVGGVDAARRVDAGEAFDFVVLAADVIEQLAAGGRVDPGSKDVYAANLKAFDAKIDDMLYGHALVEEYGASKLERLSRRNELIEYLLVWAIVHCYLSF